MKKILIVDDEATILEAASATLVDPRYEVFLASDGETALRIARAELPDLVLLDNMMPIMDGYDVCKAIKGDPKTSRIKVVIFTALVQDSALERAREVGADEYIPKPFHPTRSQGQGRRLPGTGPSSVKEAPGLERPGASASSLSRLYPVPVSSSSSLSPSSLSPSSLSPSSPPERHESG